jgi:hypothetical protein
VRISRFKLLQILYWCVLKYGINEEQYNYPDLKIHYSKEFALKRYKPYDPDNLFGILNIKGEYDDLDNVIHIYTWANVSLEDYCQTMIHEYQHYLEKENSSIKESKLEKKAEIIAQKDYLVCLKELEFLPK